MFKQIKKISERGNKINEDSIGYNDKFLFVIDGASGLSNINIMDNTTDAAWFSAKLKIELENNLTLYNKSISEILKDIVQNIKNEFDLKAEEKGIKEIEYPSASIIIFRINDNKLEYFQLGDCSANILFNDNKFLTMHDDKVSKLDNEIVKKMVKLCIDKNITMAEAKTFLKQDLINNRNKRNKIGGYFILDPIGNGIEHALNLYFKLSQIHSVSLMTDGFSCIIDTFSMFKSYEELHHIMENTDICKLESKLIEIEENDKDLKIYPRLKIRDDSSAIWAKIFIEGE